ncbi:MAG: PIN domain-containing protein [Bdellovibrio sp.]|nr:PIN domain-containing protein [Bdellovibrio sp.]
MIFIDTSVWIDFFKGKDTSLVNHLRNLLDQGCVALAMPVWIELLSGATNTDLGRLRRVLSALPRYYPKDLTWSTVEKWIEKAAVAGQRFAAVDLLIGAIVAEHGSQIWSLDRDFYRMKTLKFLEVFTPK